MTPRHFSLSVGFATALLLQAALLNPGAPLLAAQAGPERERDLLGILNSSAPKGDKAIACKKLAVYGSEAAVPALAPLLADAELASWSRIALEAIPGPAADEALRAALPKLQGRLLVGTINSIAVRKDPKAVKPLLQKLKDPDHDVASAAAVALGHIGGKESGDALRKYLGKAPVEVRPAVAEGCIRCAEHFLAAGNSSAAVKLYDAVRAAKVPKQKTLDATRGAILARKAGGVRLLAETLRSPDKGLFGMGLRTARELDATETGKMLATEMAKAPADRQPMFLLALADRRDPLALPTAVDSVKSGSKQLQIVAVGVIERMGNASTLPVLLEAASSTDAQLRQSAITALTRLPGTEVDTELVKRLPASSGRTRVALLELAGLRQVPGAVAVILPFVQDQDAATRNAALQATGILATEKELPGLLRVLDQAPESNREGIESAVFGISSRVGSACVPQLMPLTRSSKPELRIVGLRALAAAGGAEALEAVRAATEDADESVQDEAVRTLSSWPNTWPDDSAVAAPLLALATSGKKTSHQVLALRGYLHYIQGDKKLKGDDKLDKIAQVMPLAKRPEEKRLMISTLRETPAPGALAALAGLTAETGVTEDACSAILTAVNRNFANASRDDREKALKAVLEHTANDRTKRRAEELMRNLN